MTSRRQARTTQPVTVTSPTALGKGTLADELMASLADPFALFWHDDAKVRAACREIGLHPDFTFVPTTPGLRAPCTARFSAVRWAYAHTHNLMDAHHSMNATKVKAAGIYWGSRSPAACPHCDRGKPRT